ncbi:hypothetical protein KsCSTR_03330 [Candidatus Kuenenia stuttgartiensis]|uniref:Uncharacterized protein n=1 Tax=Kuenenia stuttgartiensis TaxID=174633 RepID=A0A6G7GK28_KUEST|nr:hypothetical protein KsCSTR_03330 [Candidatus Kuenenia stuttgartiensis]
MDFFRHDDCLLQNADIVFILHFRLIRRCRGKRFGRKVILLFEIIWTIYFFNLVVRSVT